jgi:leucyl aminopeptidase
LSCLSSCSIADFHLLGQIIAESPLHTRISLEYFNHAAFGQPSIIARFEPAGKRANTSIVVLGAHLDSANYQFPLLPAPGADDDCSGTVSILEAFHILAQTGYAPSDGAVDFHWYAGEEAGLLGSRDIAEYYRESGRTISAMLQLDMTAFVAHNSTDKVVIIQQDDDDPLVDWTAALAREYVKLETEIKELRR